MSSIRKKGKALRVLQIVQYLDIGGLETLVVDLSCQLKKIGIEVEILCFHPIDENYCAPLRENEIKIHVFQEKNRFNVSFYRTVSEFIRTNRFDVVHAHSGAHIKGAISSHLAGNTVFIYTAHGMPIYTRFVDKVEDSFASRLSDHIVSVSDEIDLFLKKWLIYPTCVFHTIINGVSTTQYRPVEGYDDKTRLLEKYGLPADKVLFGSVGRLDSIKNYSMALMAMKEVIDTCRLSEIGLVLVGEGPERDNLFKLARELDIIDNVYFLGMQYHIYEILPLFHFFILTSRTEGTSISLLESQSCGIPAIVTDVGGNHKVVSPDENGFLCPLDDIETMASYMKTLILQPELAANMGAIGRKKVIEKFSIESMTDQYLRIYSAKIN